MRVRSRKNTAFTLLELILVLVILAIAAGMLAPSLRWFTMGRSNANNATFIVSLGQYARSQAAAEGRVYRMNFDVQNGSIWLTAANGATFDPPPNEYGKPLDLSKGTATLRVQTPQRTDGGQYVEFQPTGRTDPAKIWLTDSGGGTIEVACLSSTEMFRVLAPEEMTQ
jgi:prepilin-type N-terminal cleavage/methylation domain-containing protein